MCDLHTNAKSNAHYVAYCKRFRQIKELRGFLKYPVVFATCPHSDDCLVCLSSGCMHPSFFAGQIVGFTFFVPWHGAATDLVARRPVAAIIIELSL